MQGISQVTVCYTCRWNVRAITYQIDKDVDSNIMEQTVDALAAKLGISVSVLICTLYPSYVIGLQYFFNDIMLHNFWVLEHDLL